MTKAISPWALSANAALNDHNSILFKQIINEFRFEIFSTDDSVWILTDMPGDGRIAFRAAFSPGGSLEIEKQVKKKDHGIKLTLSSAIGKINLDISLDIKESQPVLRYTCMLTPAKDLSIPYWPKDMLITSIDGKPENTIGQIHASQFGTRTGFIFFSQTKPESATLLYHQNLTALSDYCEQTESSLGDTVGGEWPELGFSLPPSKKPLKAGVKLTISDAFIAFHPEVPKEEPDIIELYLQLLARIYLLLPKPETKYQNWLEVLDRGLKDLTESPGCWSQQAGHKYFNAYVSDYETPPEIMVQLAVLMPLLDYTEWTGQELEAVSIIQNNLPTFYNEKLGTVMRWLPAAEDKLNGDEEQKKPMVMDSWYLHHPLINLSRLALKGDKIAKQLFLDSIKFAIKVARHFKYKWPVFYKMDTLEVVKAETAEGKGGEKDVGGIYAHVMLQAWELTKDQIYLEEAERAAKALKGYGFELFYQANDTAFASGALLRLYKITKNELYLRLSYTCLAGIFRNVQLWDCNYGYGKNFPKFFSLYPLNDAPYTAVYEEQEVFCAMHDFLKEAEDIEILPAVKLLLAEYIRYMVDRAVYYYPPMLPKEMLEEKARTGEVDPKLWIALEDLQDGWLKSGTVGQEVYGAGNAFGVIPRHYLQIPGQDFLVYIDYPTSNFSAKSLPVTFNVMGDPRSECRLMLIKTADKELPALAVRLKGRKNRLKARCIDEGHIEYLIPGNCTVTVNKKKA
ncbi:MAG TPA: hypothetical protein VKB19_04330 [Pedobacter sp.]|nr:hypothetical protein [Pedobacter sp.]